MPIIQFNAYFADEIKKVEITQPLMGGPEWNVYIDNYCVATLIYRDGEYWYHDARFEASDIQAIVDRITEVTGEGYKESRFYKFG